MRWFGNDHDGFSITDFLGTVVVVPYVVLAVASAFLPVLDDKLRTALEFLQPPATVVLTGYFGKSVLSTASDFIARLRSRAPRNTRKEE